MSCDGRASPATTLGSSLGLGGEFDLQGDMAARTAHLRAKVVVEGDIELSLTLAAKAKCSLNLPALEATVMAGPVPIGFVLTPVVEGEVAGAVRVRSAGLRVQAGVSIDQTLDFSRGVPTIRGTQSPIASLSTTSPAVTGRGEVTVRVGADLFAGPGAATKLGGVMVGLNGQIDLLRGTFGFAGSTSAEGPSRCTRAEFGFRWALGVGARAWFDFGIVSLSLSKDFTLAELKAAYGPPVMLPAGCTLDEVAPMPGDPGLTGQVGIGTPPTADAATTGLPTPAPTDARLPVDTGNVAPTPDVNFTSPGLQQCVLNEYQNEFQTTLTAITREQLAALSTLDCETTTPLISSLDGLQYASGLSALTVWGDFADLTPISGLTGLRTLRIGEGWTDDPNPAAISDLTLLSNLTDLVTLTIYDGSYTDLSPLARLGTLQSLDIEGQRVTDLSTLSSMTWLHNLTVNCFRVRDFTPVAALTGTRTSFTVYPWDFVRTVPVGQPVTLPVITLPDGTHPNWVISRWTDWVPGTTDQSTATFSQAGTGVASWLYYGNGNSWTGNGQIGVTVTNPTE
jgi:hypothetical protein